MTLDHEDHEGDDDHEKKMVYFVSFDLFVTFVVD
jgi:hypothetical protein